MTDSTNTQQQIRKHLDQRFDKLNPEETLIVTSEMLDDAFDGWKQAAEWYEAKGGLLSPTGPGEFRLKKRPNTKLTGDSPV
jgi:hypothetical protein